MSARAPEAIQELWTDIHELIPQAVLGGIVGDVEHSFGYHLARRDLPAGDYSAMLALDKKGASDCASALDVTLSPELMKLCTSRLHRAALHEDKRLAGLREFCGTLDGTETYPWDLSDNASEGLDTWDDSHLWHIHLSFYREYADNYDMLAPIAEVFGGIAETPDTEVTEMKFYNVRGTSDYYLWQAGGLIVNVHKDFAQVNAELLGVKIGTVRPSMHDRIVAVQKRAVK